MGDPSVVVVSEWKCLRGKASLVSVLPLVGVVAAEVGVELEGVGVADSHVVTTRKIAVMIVVNEDIMRGIALGTNGTAGPVAHPTVAAVTPVNIVVVPEVTLAPGPVAGPSLFIPRADPGVDPVLLDHPVKGATHGLVHILAADLHVKVTRRIRMVVLRIQEARSPHLHKFLLISTSFSCVYN